MAAALLRTMTLGLIAACAVATARADNGPTEIRIGQTLPYSGPLSGFGAIGRVQ